MDYDREKEIKDFSDVCEILKRIHKGKSAGYGDSWKKRGELISIFGNVARKFDRLENIAKSPERWLKAIQGGTVELIEETVLDLAVYGILWCVFLFQERKDNFAKAVDAALGKEKTNGKENA